MIHLWKSCLFLLCKVLFDTQYSLPVSILVVVVYYTQELFMMFVCFLGSVYWSSRKGWVWEKLLAKCHPCRNAEDRRSDLDPESGGGLCPGQPGVLDTAVYYQGQHSVWKALWLQEVWKGTGGFNARWRSKGKNTKFPGVFWVFFFRIDASVYLICRQCPLLNMAMLL